MKFIGWGRYPKSVVKADTFDNPEDLQGILLDEPETIGFGNGRSYGDSAVNKHVVFTKPYGYFIGFNEKTGVLDCQAGLTLAEIVDSFVPRGWFLKVTPGTQYITIGGAIASDVHGKNHHFEGCFSQCVLEFSLMLPDGKIITCSQDKHSDIFKATCGGMGLTGIILEAKIQLKKINSRTIKQTTIKSNNLKETFAAFEKASGSTYSVAWIDCLAKKKKIGRSLLMLGEFLDDGQLSPIKKKVKRLSFDFPGFVLNPLFIKIFNALYFNKQRNKVSETQVDINQFFYPLDNIKDWNRMYGKNGFIQYQFILPKAESYLGLEKILTEISKSGMGSFLAVLKLYGPENNNYLSFPLEGYSLALDFKIKKGLFELLDRLDQLVLEFKGRIYLAKDARVSRKVFQQGYPDLDKFKKVREIYAMDKKFHSLQSKRLGL